MNILIGLLLFAVPRFMATLGRSLPLPQPEESALVAEPHFQELVSRSRGLTRKVLQAVPVVHRACVHAETLQLDSPENAKLEVMAANIGIVPAPVLKAVSENFTLMNSLARMSEGLQLHHALLSKIPEQLQDKDTVTGLMYDIKDLNVQITKMQKMASKESAPVAQPSATPLTLHLHGEYEVQVAAHMTLVQLRSFGRDMARCLRGLDRCDEEGEGEEEES